MRVAVVAISRAILTVVAESDKPLLVSTHALTDREGVTTVVRINDVERQRLRSGIVMKHKHEVAAGESVDVDVQAIDKDGNLVPADVHAEITDNWK